MKRAFTLIISSLLFHSSILGQELLLGDLENTYLRWVNAWNEGDAATVAEISWGNYGFGRDVPFPRLNGAESKEAYQTGIKGYMDSMESLDYKVHYSNYRIVDGIGLVDGFYAQTTKPKDGPLRTVYGRQSLVFSFQDDQWKMIHYHRSALPNEFVR